MSASEFIHGAVGAPRAAVDSRIRVERLDPQSAIIHVDLSGCDRPDAARNRLAAVTGWAEALCARTPRLEHIVIVLNACAVKAKPMLRIADRLALQLHQHLEMGRGAYIAVTVVLNSPPLEPAVLRGRLLTLTSGAPGVEPVLAVAAQDITSEDISDVSVSQFM